MQNRCGDCDDRANNHKNTLLMRPGLKYRGKCMGHDTKSRNPAMPRTPKAAFQLLESAQQD
ncbi:hypothetical protein [Microcoleus sp. herbarium14]|uniref:hypothetical protein n=1 Tax=Microcoleus sp. herbarium14 TaxID=3055439 RepID=UPI002FD1923D